MIEDRFAVEECLPELDPESQQEIEKLKLKIINNLNARARIRVNVFGNEEKMKTHLGDIGANELIGALIRMKYLPLKK